MRSGRISTRGRKGAVWLAEADVESVPSTSTPPSPIAAPGRRRWGAWLATAAGAVLTTLTIWQLQQRESSLENPLAGARFSLLTDFDGIEQAAALSRDGRFVAFLSDRDGQMDVWVTQGWAPVTAVRFLQGRWRRHLEATGGHSRRAVECARHTDRWRARDRAGRGPHRLFGQAERTDTAVRCE
jgi:hypothetical protein